MSGERFEPPRAMASGVIGVASDPSRWTVSRKGCTCGLECGGDRVARGVCNSLCGRFVGGGCAVGGAGSEERLEPVS